MVVVMTAVAVTALPNLRTSDNFFAMFTARDSGRPLAEAAGVVVNNNPCLIALESDDLFSPKGLTAIRDLQASLAQTEGVDRVTSLYDIRKPVLRGVYRRMFPSDLADTDKIAEFRDLATNHPMVKGQLLSADARATLLIVELKPEFHTSAEFRPVIDRIAKQVGEVTRDANFVAEVTGPPVIQVGVTDALIKDQIIFNVAGPCVAMLIAFVLFRRSASVLIVTAAPILGVIWTLGWFALSGEELNPINGVVAPLTLTIGMADAVHVLFHIRNSIATGSAPRDAAAQAIRDVGAACLLTSLTTAIGFASMAIADFQLLRQFGIDCTVGVVMAFIAVLTVVPLLCSTPLGRRTVTKLPANENDAESQRRPLGRWHGRLARFAVRYRVPVFVGSFILTTLFVWSAQYLKVDIKLQRGLPAGPTKQAFLQVDELFGGSLPFILAVSWSPDEPPEPEELVTVVTAAQRTLTGSSINSPPLSMLTIFEMMPGQDRSPERLVGELQRVADESLNLFYDGETGRACILTRFRDLGSGEMERLAYDMDRTLAKLKQEHPGFRFDRPDSLPVSLRSASGVILDLLESLFLSVVVTIVIIGLALRSVRFGLLALLPNIFPMAALAATMLLLGIPMLVIVATVFVICFGIAVDDTIHVLTVFGRLQREGVPTEEAIERTYADIGDAIVSTTVILVSGISVVMLGQSVTTKYFGGLFIVGLLWALLGDLLILPASLACFAQRRPKAMD